MTTSPGIDAIPSGLDDTYRDLHAHPELSFAEHRTAGIAAKRLNALGYAVIEQIAGTGVVGVLRNGDGPTVLLRADMDALPVAEETGLPYASTTRAIDHRGTEVAVAHACGHDMHVTCLLGAADVLVSSRSSWQGTLIALFQPAEELVRGAKAMVDDGLYERVPIPDLVLGQHVSPLPAGLLGLHPGTAMAATDSLHITLYGTGGHGSRPESTVDPVVMAAATVMRLQTLVSREVPSADTAVLTVGALHAGTKSNVIPDRAELMLNVRSYEPAVRERLLAGIRRIVLAESQASAAPRPPDIEVLESAPALVNDEVAVALTRPALESVVPAERIVDPGAVAASEDIGQLATAAGAPCVYWFFGGADPALLAGARGLDDVRAVIARLPSNHSPGYAPAIEPTLTFGVRTLVAAARHWLQPDGPIRAFAR